MRKGAFLADSAAPARSASERLAGPPAEPRSESEADRGVAEAAPEAVKVAEALETQLAGIEQALQAYAAVEQRVIRLTRPVQALDGSDVPSAGIDVLRTEARRVLERGIPAPLPRSLTDHDDPTIRSAA